MAKGSSRSKLAINASSQSRLAVGSHAPQRRQWPPRRPEIEYLATTNTHLQYIQSDNLQKGFYSHDIRSALAHTRLGSVSYFLTTGANLLVRAGLRMSRDVRLIQTICPI